MKVEKLDVMHFLACCDFYVPAADGGMFDDTIRTYNDLCTLHKSQFISPFSGMNMWKVTVQYRTARGNTQTVEKYVCINTEHGGYPIQEIRYVLHVWSEFMPEYRKVSNVKILGAKYVCRLKIRVG